MIYFGDRDVVVKLASCGFLPRLPELLEGKGREIEIRYLVSLKAQLRRPNKRLKNAEYQSHLVDFCAAHSVIEGASDVERQEELLRAGIDPGEALLFAEAEATEGIIVTGDKKALCAYAKAATPAQRARIKVVCFEQLLLRVNELCGYETLRAGCCEGIECDKMLSLAFSSGLATVEANAVECIVSHLNRVRDHSADILLEFRTSKS
jgi:hypothetical protein